jgi:hypothetical protein
MKRPMQCAIHYQIKKLEFQSFATEIHARFRKTHVYGGVKQRLLGCKQLLKTNGERKKNCHLCAGNQKSKYELITIGNGQTIADINKTSSHPQLLQFAEVLKILDSTYLVVGEVKG